MSMRSLESAILYGAREVLNNRSLRMKDIMEWSSGDIKEQEGEVVVRVPDPGVYVAVKSEMDKRKPKKAGGNASGVDAGGRE